MAAAVVARRCSTAACIAISPARRPIWCALEIGIHAWCTCLRARSHNTMIPTMLKRIPAPTAATSAAPRMPASAATPVSVPVTMMEGTSKIGPRNKPANFNLRNRANESMATAACIDKIPSQDFGDKLRSMVCGAGCAWRYRFNWKQAASKDSLSVICICAIRVRASSNSTRGADSPVSNTLSAIQIASSKCCLADWELSLNLF